MLPLFVVGKCDFARENLPAANTYTASTTDVKHNNHIMLATMQPSYLRGWLTVSQNPRFYDDTEEFRGFLSLPNPFKLVLCSSTVLLKNYLIESYLCRYSCKHFLRFQPSRKANTIVYFFSLSKIPPQYSGYYGSYILYVFPVHKLIFEIYKTYEFTN